MYVPSHHRLKHVYVPVHIGSVMANNFFEEANVFFISIIRILLNSDNEEMSADGKKTKKS